VKTLGYSEPVRLRPASVALIALVSAVIGGLAVLGIGKSAGWIAGSGSKTVIVRTPGVAQAIANQRPVPDSARPLSGNGFDPSRIYRERTAGVVTIYAITGSDSLSAQEAQGSGFVVSPKGYVLTNSHVITNAGEGSSTVKAADKLIVQFEDGDRVPAKVVGWDIYDDVGLLQVDPAAHPLDPVPLGVSAQVRVGEPVAAIGSPFGNVNSLTVGVVSATQRSIASLTSRYSLVDAIQTDAPINHGNSGGPLFDARGRVIGINAQIRSDSGNAEGVGFAVPIDSARRSMAQLIAAGRVSYAFIGIKTQDLIPSVAKRLGYSVSRGAIVTDVTPGSPGAAAGLHTAGGSVEVLGDAFPRGGDVIVSIAGRPVRNAEDVVRVVTEQLSPGQNVPITYVRGSTRHTVSVHLAARPANPG
jgi:S1-C subfamily serine protease